jgi:hypothetical protein
MMSGQKHRVAFVAALLLAACSTGGDEDPSVVLGRAASTAQRLQSAAFDATFSYETPDGIAAEGQLNGVLSDGGSQSSFNLAADVTLPQEGVDPTVHAEANVVVAGENQIYMKLNAVDGSLPLLPGIGLVDEAMLGRWFSLGSLPSATGSVALSPDPAYIAMQASVLTVTKDRSYEKIDGARCYAYDVTIDRAKMLAFLERTATERGQTFDRGAAEALLSSYDAKGTVWIDAETSVIRQISWLFEPVAGSKNATASFSLHLSKHNEPVEITPPSPVEPLPHPVPAPQQSLPAL